MDGANKALLTGRMRLVKDTCDELEEDLIGASWSEVNPDRLVNASQYHCFDTMQYAAEILPEFVKHEVVQRTHEEQIKHLWNKEKEKRRDKAERTYRIMQRRGYAKRPTSHHRF